MADLIFNKTNSITIQPINAALWYNGPALGGFFGSYWLEKGSKYSAEAVTMPHCEGGNSQQGHILSVEMIIPHNKYDENEVIDKLETIISKSERNERIDLQVLIGTRTPVGTHPDNYRPQAANANYGHWVEFHTLLSYTYNVDHSGLYPKTIVKGSGFTFKLNDTLKHKGGSQTDLFQ